MTDKLTKQQRSFCMSQVKGKWTTQEKKIHYFLKGNKICHTMHPKILGNPDILLKENKIAVFVNGCFWHKCKQHYRKPQSSKDYWLSKINRNVERDKENIRKLRKAGFSVLVVWEHELKYPERVINKIRGLI